MPQTITVPHFDLLCLSYILSKMNVFSWSEKQEKLHQDKNYYPDFDMNVWLRSCEQEIVEPIEGTIFGTIPEWLNGCLIQNGPGSLKIGNDDVKHYFDCPALLHKFNIKNGKITYQSRFLQSDSYRRNTAANRIVKTEFGTKSVPDPCQTIFRRVSTLFKPTETFSDNASISIYPFGDEIYALGDVPVIHKINKESLETEGKVDITDHVTIVHHTSHPHVTNDGTVYNLGLSYSARGPLYAIVEFSKKDDGRTMFDEASIVAQIPASLSLNPSYMHTFGITDNYFVIVEQPLCVSVAKMVTTVMKNDPIAGCFRWFEGKKTKIYLIDREKGILKFTFYSEPFCFMHIINQYETLDFVVVDICIYNNPSFMNYMYIDAMKSMHMIENYAQMFRAEAVRFVLPLKSTTKSKVFVKPEILVDIGCELPRINYEKHSGQFYRYFYAISSDVDSSTPGAIVKVDTVTKTWVIWNEKDCYLSEPVFVERPNGQFEDDGVVLSAILWSGKPNRVGLLVLDAASFEEIGRTVFESGTPVPRCLHGWFLPQDDK